MSGYAFIDHFQTAEFLLYSFLFLLFQQSSAGEIFAGQEFGNPAQTGFQRTGVIVNIVAVQTKTHFQPQGIAGSQSYGLNAVFSTGFENSLPELRTLFGLKIEFKTACARIACVGDQDIVYTGHFAVSEMIVRNGFEVDRA